MGCGPLPQLWVGLHERHPEPSSSHPCFPHPIRPFGPPSPLRGEGGARPLETRRKINLCEFGSARGEGRIAPPVGHLTCISPSVAVVKWSSLESGPGAERPEKSDREGIVGEERKVAAILVADIVGFSRLTGADEEATLARLRALRAELFNPAVAAHGGRVVKRTGDGAIVEFRSVVEAVRCALDVTKGLAERNEALPADQRIEVRTGIHLGDVVEEADGDLMGDGVNIAARLEGICEPGGVCLSEDAWRQVRDKLPESFVDLGEQELKNIARPMRVFALRGQAPARPAAPPPEPAGVAPAPRRRRPVRALAEILDNVARLSGAYADRATRGASPAIRSAGDVPSVELRARVRRLRRAIRSAAGVPSAEARARDRSLRLAIIAAAVISLLAARACSERRPTAPPPPQPLPHTGALDDRLAQASPVHLLRMNRNSLGSQGS